MVNVASFEDLEAILKRTKTLEERVNSMPSEEDIERMLQTYAPSNEVDSLRRHYHGLRRDFHEFMEEHVVPRAVQGIAPTPGQMDKLQELVEKASQDLDAMAALDQRITRVERHQEFQDGRLDDHSTRLGGHDKLIAELQSALERAKKELEEKLNTTEAKADEALKLGSRVDNLETGQERLGERLTSAEGKQREDHEKLGQIEGWQTSIYNVLAINNEGTESGVLKGMQEVISDIALNVGKLNEKAKFSFTPILIGVIAGLVIGLLIGLPSSHWVIGSIVGAAFGAIIGLFVASRDKKTKTAQTNNTTNGEGAPAQPAPAPAPEAPVATK